MMAVEAMPTPAAVKPLAKREADFSARPSVRFGVIRVVSAMLPVSPLYPHEPTSSVRPTTSEKCQNQTARCVAFPIDRVVLGFGCKVARPLRGADGDLLD